MTLGAITEILVFAVFALIAIAGALGMTTTMSMFRSGIFLMASFIGVAGLFILLMADLLGMLQVMMYIGGMLVMILFMVLFSGDPGGAMMAKMKMPFIEKIFSMGLLPKEKKDEHKDHSKHNQHEDGDKSDDNHKHGGGDDGGMNMDMSMFTPLKKYAAWIGLATSALLIWLFLVFGGWPVKEKIPNQDAAQMVGDLLMGKYMMAFEGAGLMILLGIFGAIYLARAGKHPDSKERGGASAINEEPQAPVEDPVNPYFNVSIDELYKKAEEEK